MPSIDAMRLLAISAVALSAVVSAVWLIRRPSGLRTLAFGCALSVLCMAAPATVMAFGRLSGSERIIGRVRVAIPAAEPYRDVPAPEPGRHAEMMTL